MGASRVGTALLAVGAVAGGLAGAGPASHLPRGYEAFRIAFSDARHGVMSAARIQVPCARSVCTFRVYATSNGGRSWRRALSAPLSAGSVAELGAAPGGGVFWAAFPCDRGAACRSTVFRSDDGGRRWRVVSHTWLREPAFATARHGWAIGFEGGIVVTRDGGRRWRALPKDPCPFANGAERHPAPVGPNRGWLLCSALGSGLPGERALYETRDGGRHWRLRAARGAGLPRRGRGFDQALAFRNVSFRPSGRGWIWRYASAAPLVTHDGGRTWRLATSRRRWPYPSMTWGAAPLDAVAFAVADTTREQLLVRTADGGRRWRVVHRWPRGTR